MLTPVYKEGDKRDCGNYRPIAVPTAISKVYESFLNVWLVTILTLNNIIYKNQFGFQNNSSTTSAVTNLTEFITTKLDRGQFVGVIFLDIRKAM